MSSGADSLSDDEYQFIRYMDIMVQETDDICVDEDFNAEDEYCSRCDNVEACLLRRIHTYL
jgi:hypothetical protein